MPGEENHSKQYGTQVQTQDREGREDAKNGDRHEGDLARAQIRAMGRTIDEIASDVHFRHGGDPTHELKDELAASIAERYGVILPYHIRVGATPGQIRDIRGLLFDAQRRYQEGQEKRAAQALLRHTQRPESPAPAGVVPNSLVFESLPALDLPERLPDDIPAPMLPHREPEESGHRPTRMADFTIQGQGPGSPGPGGFTLVTHHAPRTGFP
jgi:hypothetical protein